jgi:hypothetical protein
MKETHQTLFEKGEGQGEWKYNERSELFQGTVYFKYTIRN